LLAAAALTLEAIGDRSWDGEVRDWCSEAISAVPAGTVSADRTMTTVGFAGFVLTVLWVAVASVTL
jgi:hypothetical protein